MTDEALRDEIHERLRGVMDPEIHRDIVSLGMVKAIDAADGAVALTIELTTPACPLKETIQADVEKALAPLGLRSLAVRFTANVASRSGGLPLPSQARLGGIRNVLAVASGKGGVGKSTVAANLALALRDEGARVGLMDADIYGPSQPLMFGLSGRQPDVTPEGKIVPLVGHGVTLMSIGFLVEAGRSIVWRGPLIHKALTQFFDDVLWGDLDYLVVDLPPGTGDAQLSLCQLVPLTGSVMVTTPQEVALIDVRKGADMFRKLNVPILGVIENMSSFICPCCGTRSDIFDHGGGERLARELGCAFLGAIPIDPRVRAAGDAGVPVVLSHPESDVAASFRSVARSLAGRVSVEVLSARAPAVAV